MKWTYLNDKLFEITFSNISFDQTIRVATRLGISDFVDLVRISKISCLLTQQLVD